MAKCMKCGGMKKYAAGGSKMKTTVGSATPKGQIYGIPQTGPTGPNYQGVDTMKKGGIKKAAFGKSVSVQRGCPAGYVRSASGTGCVPMGKRKDGGSLGMKSVNAGIDKNPGVTRADIIAAANKKKTGGMTKKAAGGPILDKLKAKLAERKVTKAIKKSVKSSGKIIK